MREWLGSFRVTGGANTLWGSVYNGLMTNMVPDMMGECDGMALQWLNSSSILPDGGTCVD